jgi:hypothetical protein
MNPPKHEEAVVIEIGPLRLTASGRFAIVVMAVPTVGLVALLAGHYYGFW